MDGSRIHENLYWIAVSNNPEPSAKIDLDGLWRSADGDMIELPGNDMSIPNPSFEYVILKNKVSADLESADGTCQSGGGTKQPRHYTRTFSIPSELQGNELEFFCPGFESGDEVHVNGVRIGGHEFEGQKLDTGKWCFIPAGRKNTSINVDRTSEYLYYSDPISLPKLDARFYDIPMEALNPDDDNEIRLTITSDYQKACSNHMEIRPRTLNRSKIAAYLKKGVFFKDLRRMPMANVEVTVDGNHITLENRSEAVAFMLIVEIIPKDTGVALPLSDNAINIMPGEIKSLKPLFEDAIPKPSKLWIYGWNVEEKVLQIVEPGCLDA